ncbi:MAG: putative toxin-antitoxin system toxin component, PIN family [Tepidisphaeraceae bacterium]|jgi:putative PIN family toxin of toxin-antitoxin system
MSAAKRQRAVYDCNIYVQALLNLNGPAGTCIRSALEDRVWLFVSEPLLSEIRDAPNKPTPARLGVTIERTETLIANILKVATVVAEVPVVFTYDRDPDDAHYVNLALAAEAKLIVSRDRDLLDLMDESRPEARIFQQRFPSLRILEPVQFLRELTAEKSEAPDMHPGLR